MLVASQHGKGMTRIRTLKPNVAREQAIQQFAARGAASLLRNAAFGPLRSVAEFYVPFRLFRAEIVNRGVIDARLFALDGFSGTLDLYRFDHPPRDEETLWLDTRNVPELRVPAALATELVVGKLRRILYSRGFFRMRGLRIAATPLDDVIHIPYWIGFRGSDGHVRVSVIDAVRRTVEGAKLKRLVEVWLTSRS